MSTPLPADDANALSLIGRSLDNAWNEIASRNLDADPIGPRKAMSLRIMGAVLVGVRDVDRLTLLALDTVDQGGT